MDAAKQERVRERMRQAEAEGVAAAKLQAWLASDAAAKATWKHRRPDLPDQTLAGYDVELCRLAAGAGWSDADLAELIAAHHAAYGGAKEGRCADYVARTIASARSQQDDTAARPNGAGGPQQANGEDRGAHAGDAGGEQQKRGDSPGADPAMLGLVLWQGIDDMGATDRLVKGLIGENSFSVIAGPSGTGKTFFALDLAAHLAAGWDWFGRKVSGGGVLYVSAEGHAGIKKRVKAWKKEHPNAPVDMPFALYPAAVDLVTDPNGAENIIARVELLRGLWRVDVGFVVLDTLARCFGSGDESSTRDMNTFVMRCDTIRKTGAAVGVVHHFGKDESKGMRGSIALKAAADTVIEVTGTEGVRTARVEKQKDGATGEAFTFTLKPLDLGPDEDNDPITSCVVVPSDATAANKATRPPPAEYLKARDYLADVIADAGETVVRATMPTNVKVTTVERWRERLEKRGLYEAGDKGRQWFQRVRNRLIADNIIAMDDPYVWIIPKRDARDAT